MACPICGANCRCKNAGPGGLCCSCHRHKVNGAYIARGSYEEKRWREEHGYDGQQRLITDTLKNPPASSQGSDPLEWSPGAIWYDRLCLVSRAIGAMAFDALWPEAPWVPIVRCEPI